ncbi:kinase [Paracoccus suum]|uniref:Kinase n=1 Tax=Paracoccus suum TaxID=2259340 RepID=A0A344PJQ0_9RHOB|nr:PfkB family carbohydrate kinase [Paracoccus suum]AXC49605.1 kinase [Paracoccus suum]
MAEKGLACSALCIGAAHWDLIGRSAATVMPGDDLTGTVTRRAGGVAVNVARALNRAGISPLLLSAVGDDGAGAELGEALGADGIGVTFLLRLPGHATGSYVAVEDPSGLIAAIADTTTLEAAGARILTPLRDGSLASAGRPFAGVAVIDGNLSPELLARVVAEPGLRGADLRVASASPAKAARLRPLLGRTHACLCLNRAEAEAICGETLPSAAAAVQALLSRGVRRAIVTDGPRPAAEASSGEAPVTATPPNVSVIAHVTGAGDTALAAHIAAEMAGASRQAALTRAVAAASAHISAGSLTFAPTA